MYELYGFLQRSDNIGIIAKNRNNKKGNNVYSSPYDIIFSRQLKVIYYLLRIMVPLWPTYYPVAQTEARGWLKVPILRVDRKI